MLPVRVLYRCLHCGPETRRLSHFRFWYPGTREDSVSSAPGTLGTREDSVISAFSTLGTREDTVISAFGTPGLPYYALSQ